MTPSEPPLSDEPAGRLDSWKEIAAYLRRSVRSARRWEKEEGLPVHRHLHSKRDSVYAYKSELDAWWSTRGAVLSRQRDAEDASLPPETGSQSRGGGSEEPTPEEGEAPATPTAGARRLPRLTGVAIALVVLAAAGLAWLARNSARAATGSLRDRQSGSRDCVLVARFENRTGEKLFDGTLDYALGRELSNSRQVTIASRDRVNDALRLMRRPADSQIDASLAREMCLRDGGIKAFLTGRIEKVGTRYVCSVDLVDPREGVTRAALSQESATPEGSLGAVRRLSDQIRAELGDKSALRERQPEGLAKVTTANLRALQLYSEADFLMSQGSEGVDRMAAAEELLRQAVAEDPRFASAWIHLAFALANQERPLKEILPYAEKAMQLSEDTTERERYFIRGAYYDFTGDRRRAIGAYEALLDLYPDHHWALGNLYLLYDVFHNPEELVKAVDLQARFADTRPNDFIANWNAAFDIAALKRQPAKAQPYLRRASELVTPELRERFFGRVDWLELLPFTERWVKGDLGAAAAELERAASRIDSLVGQPRDCLAAQIALGYLTLGQIATATRTAETIADPVVRSEVLAQVDFIKGDNPALRRHLQLPGDDKPRRFVDGSMETTLGLQVRAGLLLDADAYKGGSHWREPNYADEEFRRFRGEVALARGDIPTGIRELEEACRLAGDRYYAPNYSLGREMLAAELARQGNLPHAIQILERNPESYSAVISGTTGAFWLVDRWELAKLYRRAGREEDARAVEAELARRLALADSDHPILVELKRLHRA
jgi:tetratricopeptide (TPR) repeat protein